MRLWFGRRRRGVGRAMVGAGTPTGGVAAEQAPASVGGEAPAESVAGERPIAEAAPEPSPADMPQSAPREAAPADQPIPVPDPTGALAPESLDRALERLRAKIPARDDDASR